MFPNALKRELRRRCAALTAALLVSGCADSSLQSAMHPAGPAAQDVATMTWIMAAVFTATTVLVTVLLLLAIFVRRRPEQDSPPLGRVGFIVAGGVVLPLAVVGPLLIYSLETSAALRMPDGEALSVHVEGFQWWWAVRYPESGIVTANEIHIPVGQPVRLVLTSADVIHSFWVPALHGKRDMIPGVETEFWIQADRPGVYRGQCAEYCGLQHAHMALVVVALPPEEFAEWVEQRREPPPSPTTEKEQRGLAVFLGAGCARCHAIRGTPAAGVIAPDLTHIGSRRTLGAGMIPNNYGNLTGWIGNAPAVKPGVRMPASYLPAEDLHALATYLQGLK